MDTFASNRVDRRSSVPMYQQVYSNLLTRISQGEWHINEKLPAENDLTKEYGASRVTIREALEKLELDGFVDRQRGKGTFVKAIPSIIVHDLYIPQIGVRKKSDIVSGSVSMTVLPSASSLVQNHLSIGSDKPVLFLERLFYKENRPVGVNKAYFPLDMVPDLVEKGLINNSITDTLQKRYGIVYDSVENYIESISMDTEISNKLSVLNLSPALKISTLYKKKNGTPIEFSVTVWNGKDTQFRVVLSSN